MATPEGEGDRDPTETPQVGFDLKERAMDEAPVGITISDPDRTDNPLVYVNDAFERVTGYPRGEVLGRNCRFLQGEGTAAEPVAELARAIEEEEAVTVELLNYRRDGEAFWNEVTVAPVEDESGEVTNFVGFQADVTERKRAQLEVERERENLSHLLDRINGLLGDVTSDVVSADGRSAIERAVCRRVVEADPYTVAWVGDVDITGESIRPHAWRGTEGVTESDLAVRTSETDHPVVEALETGEVQVVEGDAAAEAMPGDLGGVAAVPLEYRGTSYGVIVIGTPERDVLDDRETTVLAALGRVVATAINAHQSRRILSTNDVVEIELEITDSDFFPVGLSTRLGAPLEYRGGVATDGSYQVFFATDAPPRAVSEATEGVEDVERVTPVGDEPDAGLFEFTLTGESIVSELADRGARTRSLTAESGTSRLELELPASANARALVESVQDRFPGTELVSYHETERPPKTRREFVADLESKLTDRQRTALKKAFVSGYYEWNRTTSGDELAESMGISRSTFHQHLRAAERKLLEAFFGRDPN